MAVTTSKKTASTSSKTVQAKKKTAAEAYGAPAQPGQASRKGKRAWRKNVDIGDVEVGLEKLREDIRTTGGPLHEKSDTDLFMVDVTGNERVRKKLGKPLKSLAILKERSAVPAVFSRPAKSEQAKAQLSRDAKDRIRRKAGRHQLYRDPTILEVTEAVKHSGEYDVWSGQPDPEAEENKLTEEAKDFIGSLVKKPNAKPPRVLHPSSSIALPPIPAPHPGQSYNPPVGAHQALLLAAHQTEVSKEAEYTKAQEVKQKLDRVRALRVDEAADVGVAPGMQVDDAEAEEEAEVEGGETEIVVVRSTVPKWKTKQQRNRAAKVLAEQRALQAAKARKRLLASLTQLPSLTKAVSDSLSTASQRLLARKAAASSARAAGLAGVKLGKHRVPEGRMEVQLGDELAETLREMKPEGNLFRERFESLQQRGRVEPRALVLPRRRKLKVKSFERFMYKRFV